MSTPATPVIAVRQASVWADDTEILHAVDWEVLPGQHWFVLGANGSGKTTLMQVVTGVTWPSLGARVQVLGATYGECVVRDVRRQIGWVGSFFSAWLERLHVLQLVLGGFDGSIGFFREPSDGELAAAQRRLAELGLEGFAARRFGTLSAGEQMRVLIARALVADPRLLLLDEPCSHLDLRAREYFLDAIRQLTRGPDAPTVVFVTHRVDDIVEEFTHGLVLGGGRVLASGPRAAVLTEPMLCQAFGVPLRLLQVDGRYWTHLAPEARP